MTDNPMTQATDALEDLPPSAKLVYYVLDHADGPLDTAAIAEESRLAERTVRYGIQRLQEAGRVTRTMDPEDLDGRKSVYRVTENTAESAETA